LQGKDIFFEKERKPGGYLTRNITGSDQKGSDLFLTIDYNIQFQAEKLLEEAEKNLGAEGGEIIVIDPTNGKIIALASLPGFNPNQYFEVKNLEVFKNPVVQKIFEPGSAFKPITMAIALDLGKIKPQTTYNDPGIMHVDGWPIRNYAHRVYPGDITMTEVLEKSINTGAVFAVNQVENSDFLEYLERFGLFEKTEIDLKGEIAPSNRELKQGRDINFATASYGQGIEMTPLQLVRAFSAVANNGKLVRPYLVEKIIKNDGVFETEHQVSSDNVISHSTAVKLTTMLVSVVEEGFSKAARIPGYYVAGKTGTAQVSFAALGIDKKGYSEKTWQSFVGYAPAFNPQFLILVKLNNPGTRTAEYSAVPVFRELAKYIIDYWQIPPDY